MNFNDSFGDIEANNANENNINIISIEKGDITDVEGQTKKDNENNKEILNTSFSNNNNIFSSLPLEMEIDKEYSNSNNLYDELLSKELLKYNISNLFNILKSKIIIIKSQIFYKWKKISDKKMKNLLNSEILFLKVNSSINMLFNIIGRNRSNKLYQAFCIMKNKCNINDKFKSQYESKYKKEKDKLLSEKNNILKNLEKEIKDIEKNIISLNKRENENVIEINNLTKKEKQLKEQIKSLENSNSNNMKKSEDAKKPQQSSNISSINNNSKYDSEIISLESTIETSKQLKEGKEEIIKNFINKMNDLLNEYQVYIDMLNNNDRNNHIDNSNQQSLSHKDKDGSGNTWYSSKTNSGNQPNRTHQNNIYNEQGNMNINEH